jgi:biopolymer transport protein ExbD
MDATAATAPTPEAEIKLPPKKRQKAATNPADQKAFTVQIDTYTTKTKSKTHGRAAARGFSAYLSSTKQRNKNLEVVVQTTAEGGGQHMYKAQQTVLDTPIEIKRGNSIIQCKCKTKVTAIQNAK